MRCFPVFTPLGVPRIFTRNPSWCVRTLHFFNCYHHPSNNMLHGFISLQEGFCPLSPAVTIPVDSHSPHCLCLFPQKEPFAWTEAAHHITSCQVERCIAAETCHCWCLNCPSGSPLNSQTLVSEIHDSKLLGTIFGQSRMISHPVFFVCQSVCEDDQQGASAGSLMCICSVWSSQSCCCNTFTFSAGTAQCSDSRPQQPESEDIRQVQTGAEVIIN